MFVADGHHRYETACNYKAQLMEQQGTLAEDHPANFVMTMLVGMSDPGMIVLPTHRLLRGTPRFTSAQIIELLGDAFECRVLGGGLAAADEAWSEMESADEQGLIGLYATGDDILGARPSHRGSAAEDEGAREGSKRRLARTGSKPAASTRDR